MKRTLIIAYLLFAASASAEPLRISDNPYKACRDLLAMNAHDQQVYGAGFFVAASQGEPLVWYAVLVNRTFADGLREYCERNRGESLQSVASKTSWTIWYRMPQPAYERCGEQSAVSTPSDCDTCD